MGRACYGLNPLKQIPRFFAGTFSKTAGVLGISNGLAQMIGLATLIVLDRVTSQQTIGQFAEFVAITSMLLPAGLLSLHLALPGTSHERMAHMGAAMIPIGTLTALCAGAVAFVINYEFWLQLGLMIMVSNWAQLADQMNINTLLFRGMLINRILSRIIFILLLPAWFALTCDGIPAETVINLYVLASGTCGAVYFCLSMRLTIMSQSISVRDAWNELRTLADYPLYVAPSQIINSAAHNIPVILIAHYFGPTIAAQYSITLRFCFAPIQLLAGAINQAVHFEFAHILDRNPRAIAQRFSQIYRPVLLSAEIGRAHV